jgi:membrane protein implicated in regulation of membrane protease activity
MMTSFLDNADYIERIFWICALTGSLFFLLKVVTAMFSSFGDHSSLSEVDGDPDLSSSDQAFKLFSIHSLTGFFMMFGWVGLASYKQFMFSSELSTLIAFIGGLLMMIITSMMFKLAAYFVSPGSSFSLDQLKGKYATVYQEIPADGTGKIHITVDGILREVQAVSLTKKKINSFTHVEIVQVPGNQTVVVSES